MTKKRKVYKSVDALLASGDVAITTREDLEEAYNTKDLGAAFDRHYEKPLKRGRPAKGSRAVGTVTRSVRATEAFFDRLAAVAENEGLTAHEAMRQALVEWLARHRPPQRSRSTRRYARHA